MPDVSSGCPVTHTEYGEDSEIYGHYALLQRDLEGGRFLYNDTRPGGFYMIQRWQDVREALQIGAWTTDRRSALSRNAMRLLPQDLNGRPHVVLRRVLNQFFERGGRTLDHLAGGDAIDERFRQKANRHAAYCAAWRPISPRYCRAITLPSSTAG